MMIKRTISYILAFLLIFGCIMHTYAEETQADMSVSNGCHSIDAQKPYIGQGVLVENMKSAFLYEINSQSLLYAYNSDLPQYPASLVKIMTALLVLENAELDATVTVSQTALDSVSSNAISVNLQAGEQITVENLMYCMMVKSANDAAAVLAEHISGSQDAFVAKMNDRAAELGCTGTKYVNVHGLHHDEQVTTAKDTCRVLQEAMKHESFRTFFGTAHYTVPATNLSEERILTTNNYLMSTEDVGIYLDSRVTGGRTGVTTEGFRCIASTAQSGNMDVICIVMGCASTILENGHTDVYGAFPETIQLLNYAFDGNAMHQIVFADQILSQHSVLNGDSDVFAMAKENIFAVLPAEYGLKNLSFQYTEAAGASQAPITKGQSLGSVQIMYGSSCVAQTELFAANDVDVAVSKEGAYLEPESNKFPWVLILILVVLAAAGLVVYRKLRIQKNTSRRRRT